jgi:hypothetical protein
VAKILNHAEREVTAVYDRHSYDQEKRQALEAWGSRLEKIVTGTQKTAKIVPCAAADGAPPLLSLGVEIERCSRPVAGLSLSGMPDPLKPGRFLLH